MTLFQETEGQRVAAYLETLGVSRYRVGGAAVMFQLRGAVHCASSMDEARRIAFNLSHVAAMETLRAARAA